MCYCVQLHNLHNWIYLLRKLKINSQEVLGDTLEKLEKITEVYPPHVIRHLRNSWGNVGPFKSTYRIIKNM